MPDTRKEDEAVSVGFVLLAIGLTIPVVMTLGAVWILASVLR